jgi:hypothetical protein
MCCWMDLRVCAAVLRPGVPASFLVPSLTLLHLHGHVVVLRCNPRRVRGTVATLPQPLPPNGGLIIPQVLESIYADELVSPYILLSPS